MGVGELLDQARLADARVAEHGRQLAAPGRGGRIEGVLEDRPFHLATDQRGGPDRLRADRLAGVPDAHEPVGRHALGLALELQGLDRFDLDLAPDEVVRRLADEDLVGRGGLLQACRDVDRVAGGQLLVRVGVGVGDDLAGVDAGPVGELDAVELQEVDVQGGEFLLHPVGGPDGAQCVVLVGSRDPEDGHDRVADVLLDRPAVFLDLGGHDGEVALLDLVHRLLVDALRERGRSLQVDEDERGRLADLRPAEFREVGDGDGFHEGRPGRPGWAAAGAGAHGRDRDVPQKPHIRKRPGFSSLQAGHRTVSGGASAVPQNPHRRNLAGFSSPHPGQLMTSMTAPKSSEPTTGRRRRVRCGR